MGFSLQCLEFEERKNITISRKPFLPCCDWKQKVNKSFLMSTKLWPIPLRGRVVLYYTFADRMGRKTESLPQIVHLVILKGRITNALPSTLVYGWRIPIVSVLWQWCCSSSLETWLSGPNLIALFSVLDEHRGICPSVFSDKELKKIMSSSASLDKSKVRHGVLSSIVLMKSAIW